MRNTVTTAILVGALTAVSVVRVGATPGKASAQSTAKPAATSTVANHSTTGVVKSVDVTTLVITRSGKKGGEMTFALNPATHREGTVEVGSPVSIRYREDGKTYVATAITAEHPKGQAAHKAPSGR